MGEAKRRGTFEQRKEQSKFYASEQARLDKWLMDRRPKARYELSDGSIKWLACTAAFYRWGCPA